MLRSSKKSSRMIVAVAGLSLSGCWPLGSAPSTSNPPSGKTAVFLEYNHTFDQPGDDVGGAKQQVEVPIVWSGTRVGGEGPSDTFSKSDSYLGFVTDPWYDTTIVNNLEPGDWNLAVNVNGLGLACPTPITLASGVQVNVTFQIDKVTGQFAGCTHN